MENINKKYLQDIQFINIFNIKIFLKEYELLNIPIGFININI